MNCIRSAEVVRECHPDSSSFKRRSDCRARFGTPDLYGAYRRTHALHIQYPSEKQPPCCVALPGYLAGPIRFFVKGVQGCGLADARRSIELG